MIYLLAPPMKIHMIYLLALWTTPMLLIYHYAKGPKINTPMYISSSYPVYSPILHHKVVENQTTACAEQISHHLCLGRQNQQKCLKERKSLPRRRHYTTIVSMHIQT